LRGLARGDGAARRRAHLPAGARPRADRGRAADDRLTPLATMNEVRKTRARPLFDSPLVRRALLESFLKLHPRVQVRNPVLFVVWIGALLTSALALEAALGRGEAPFGFVFAVALWLWATVLFANLAEGRGKAQAQALRSARRDVIAKKLVDPKLRELHSRERATDVRKGDHVLVE